MICNVKLRKCVTVITQMWWCSFCDLFFNYKYNQNTFINICTHFVHLYCLGKRKLFYTNPYTKPQKFPQSMLAPSIGDAGHPDVQINPITDLKATEILHTLHLIYQSDYVRPAAASFDDDVFHSKRNNRQWPQSHQCTCKEIWSHCRLWTSMLKKKTPGIVIVR